MKEIKQRIKKHGRLPPIGISGKSMQQPSHLLTSQDVPVSDEQNLNEEIVQPKRATPLANIPKEDMPTEQSVEQVDIAAAGGSSEGNNTNSGEEGVASTTNIE